MSQKYILIANHNELTVVQKDHPELINAPLILLSDNFNPDQLSSYHDRSFSYYDECINDQEARSMADSIHNILWNWYRDENALDLSKIDGLSLGITFAPSMEILLNSIMKYEVALSCLLKAGDEVFFVSNTDDIFSEVIKQLQNKINFRMQIVRSEKEYGVVLYGAHKVKLESGKRDLSPYFKVSWRGNICNLLLKIARKFRHLQSVAPRVMLYSSGKLKEYIDKKIQRSQTDNEMQWIFPISSLKDLLRLLGGRIDPRLHYYFTVSNNRPDARMNRAVSGLEENIRGKVKALSSSVLISLMRKYIFMHFSGALSYYHNSVEEIKYLKPKMIVVSSDVGELHLIVAQAAKKAGVRTALLPHGIDCWGYKELRAGDQRIIDYCLAYGRKHVMDNEAYGVPSGRIVVTSFPYFSRFFPIGVKRDVEYRKALILAPDFLNVSPASQQRYFFDFINKVIRLLKEINIQIVGIKSRGDYAYLMHDIKADHICLNNEKVRLFSGYTNFPDVAKEADLIIGNSSTAVIEAGLMGIDYYVIYPKSYNYVPSVSRSIENILFVAHTINDLRENINNRRTYRPGHSVDDFVAIKDSRNKEELYDRFESAIQGILKDKGRACS